METTVEKVAPTVGPQIGSLSITLLGPPAIARNGAAVALPASRKVRALLGYLALAPQPVGRGKLCDLLWDVPNDPRGELRWCLSKLRAVLDESGCQRVETAGDTVQLRFDGCSVDAVEIARAAAGGLDTLGLDRLRHIASLFSGDFLDGVELDRSAHFDSWLTAQRRRFQALRIAVLEQLVSRLPGEADEAMPYLENWLELSPFDIRAHLALLAGLVGQGRIDACEEHLGAAARLFSSEEMDFAPVRDAWRELRARTVQTPFAQVATASPAIRDVPIDAEGDAKASRRASLAVMPFTEHRSGADFRGGLADGLTHDIITRLAKLRDLFIIARGSVYALAERGIGPEDAGRRLNVDYVASGAVSRSGERVTVSVELVDVPTARIIWSETFEAKPDDLFPVLDEIGNSIVSSISNEIETVERNRAMLKAPSSLNAWEAYHRGLWHMYRFTQAENDQARHFFEVATRLDPTFARAHAGLSFTHWQNAFQHWGDRDRETGLAYETAGQSLLIDDHNPAGHWAMGRALWLRGSNGESLGELERAVDLSPNFALGHYALSFVQCQSGDPLAAIGSADQSRHLSPFDPLMFGMLGARAMAHVRLGQFEEAADWALKAAARPNSHAIILAIAANCLGLAGRIDEGRTIAARIRHALPHYNADEFLASFRFAPDAAALFRQGAKRIGLD